jgi:hypothetical protein
MLILLKLFLFRKKNFLNSLKCALSTRKNIVFFVTSWIEYGDYLGPL